jgi:signal transduction histidine kinase
VSETSTISPPREPESLCYSREQPRTAEVFISKPLASFERSRYRATIRLFRQLRHDLATPLSGAALHLEVACRRLGQGSDLDVSRVLENVRMGQLEVGYASAMLEVLTEVVRSSDEDAEPFSLTEALAHGMSQIGNDRARAHSVKTPRPTPNPLVHGSRRQVEQAFLDLTFYALQRAEPDVVEWTLEEGGEEARLACRFRGKLPEGRSDQVFSLSRGSVGETPGPGLLLARWAVQSQGGELVAEQVGEDARFVASFPVVEKGAPS